MKTMSNIKTKVEIFNYNKTKSFGFIDIENITNFTLFYQQVSTLTEIKNTTRIKLISPKLFSIESNLENFRYIKECILSPVRKEPIWFKMEDLFEIISKIEENQNTGNTGILQEENFFDENEFNNSELVSYLNFSSCKDDITNKLEDLTQPITQNQTLTIMKNKSPSKANPSHEILSFNNSISINNQDYEHDKLPQNSVTSSPTTQNNNNSSISEVKLLLDGKEIRIIPSCKEVFIENQKKLKCSHCRNFLFGAKTCKTCFMTFCSKCVSGSTKCPDSDCPSSVFEEIVNDALKSKLNKVLLECEKECGDEDVSMLNYLGHLNKCQGMSILILYSYNIYYINKII